MGVSKKITTPRKVRDGVWKINCTNCGDLPGTVGSWTAAASVSLLHAAACRKR